MSLEGFVLNSIIKQKKIDLFKKALSLEVIPKKGNFTKYVRHVTSNKDLLIAEYKYVKNILKNGNSWGEILVIKNKDNQIVGSFGPNRIGKEDGKKRAMPGYFFVLPEWRNLGIGTVLWNIGIERMKKKGADFIICAVESTNTLALKIYTQMGMKQMTNETYEN